jgi:hypothetical protein
VSPVLMGLIGVGAGVALWELLLRPAPLDYSIGCAHVADAKRAVAILEQNGIAARAQQVFGDSYAVLVKRSDFIRAPQLTKGIPGL